MDIIQQLDEVSRDFGKLFELIDRASAQGDPSAPLLEEMRGTLETQFAEAQRLAPLALKEVEQTKAEIQGVIAEAQANLTQAQEQIDLFDNPPPAPPPPPPISVEQGHRLAAELLQRYRLRKPAAARAQPSAGDVAALPSGEFTSVEMPATPPPAPGRITPPSPPPRPARPPASDSESIASSDFSSDE